MVGLCAGFYAGQLEKRFAKCLTVVAKLVIISFLCCSDCGGSLKN